MKKKNLLKYLLSAAEAITMTKHQYYGFDIDIEDYMESFDIDTEVHKNHLDDYTIISEFWLDNTTNLEERINQTISSIANIFSYDTVKVLATDYTYEMDDDETPNIKVKYALSFNWDKERKSDMKKRKKHLDFLLSNISLRDIYELEMTDAQEEEYPSFCDWMETMLMEEYRWKRGRDMDTFDLDMMI